ncbi:unnamed protein product [Phytophthora lilii]|uniref:Unnamed protein product n=1 Tax=Phytophthora lilii TaxID=2077276 RepID=A0A9W7CQ90_9STRA|nr:unnamed protein product [Phytophthora lilii]
MFGNKIVEAIYDQFERAPEILAPKSIENFADLANLLRALTSEVGPLFIMFDEIGCAFSHATLNDYERREQFVFFCEQVLFPLFMNPNLFFLIAGRATFLNYVGSRPTKVELSSSPVKFQRIGLNLLRPYAIKEIIKKTVWLTGQTVTIKEHYGMDDAEVQILARHLFKMTYGHPRSLVAALKKYDTYEILMTEYTTPDIPGDSVNWQDFAVRVRYYENPLKEMMDSAVELTLFDIRSEWRDKGLKTITYDLIANMLGIAWEGTIDEATLYMPPYVQLVILASIYPFKDLMDKVAPSIGRIAVEYAEMFELLCLARFQEVFCAEACPSDVLSAFFTTHHKFGRRADVRFAKSTSWMPKIINNGNQSNPSLSTVTAHPRKWSKILDEIDEIVADQGALSLKPLPQSASSDILLMSLLEGGTKLTVGLAVRNDASSKTKVSKATIEDECGKFNRMFSSSEGRLNVLIVCATAYTDTVMNSQSDVEKTRGCLSTCYPTAGYDYIHEVILLFLTTPENRSKFFGIQGNEQRKEALEKIIRSPCWMSKFCASSWTLDEYLEAIEDEELFQTVKPYLDASDDAKLVDEMSTQARRWSLVQSKFYFAGCEARSIQPRLL